MRRLASWQLDVEADDDCGESEAEARSSVGPPELDVDIPKVSPLKSHRTEDTEARKVHLSGPGDVLILVLMLAQSSQIGFSSSQVPKVFPFDRN